MSAPALVLLAAALVAAPLPASPPSSTAPTLVAVGHTGDAAAAAEAVGGVLVRDLAGPRVALVLVPDAPATLYEPPWPPGVRYVEPARPLALEERSNDVLADAQWALAATHLPAAWDVVPRADAVTVAVVDTGVDLAHPDLAPNLWRNPGEAVNGADDDGNGFVDDVAGVDFCTGLSPTARVTPLPVDQAGHGTHVAGIAGAVRDNTVGIAGAADVRVMPLKVFGPGGVGTVCDSTLAAAAAVTYAAEHGARVISMSWYAAESRALEDALRAAWARDVLLVKSAGNGAGGPVSYPGSLPFVLAVGAVHAEGGYAGWASTGRGISVTAPGENVVSTEPGGAYGRRTGTSMAAPLVAGIAGLVRAHCPDLTAAEVWATLNATARDLGAPGHDAYHGHGLVDAHAAVTRCAARPESPPVSAPPAPGTHAPVVIDGDADLCADVTVLPGGARVDANGIVNCGDADGSRERPFVIAGWSWTLPERPRDGDPWVALEVRGTTKHIVIRENVFRDARADGGLGDARVQTALRLRDVASGTITVTENAFERVAIGVHVTGTDAHVTHNAFRETWKHVVLVEDVPATGSAVIARNTFHAGWGPLAVDTGDGAAVTVRHNNFGGNHGIVAVARDVDLSDNWWGDARGPDAVNAGFAYERAFRGLPWADAGHPVRNATTGDAVPAGHLVAPWLTLPVPDAGPHDSASPGPGCPTAEPEGSAGARTSSCASAAPANP